MDNTSKRPTAAELITSTSAKPDGPKTIHPIAQPTRFADVVAGIARTKNVLVLCSDSALVGTGIKPLDDAAPLESETRRVSYRNLITETTKLPEKLSTERLAEYNRIMTQRRIDARQARDNVFLSFLDRLCADGRLAKCLTTSIDGLELRNSPHNEDKVVRLYGNNQVLRCLTATCEGLDQIQSGLLDDQLCTQERVICRRCHDKNKKNNMKRRTGDDGTRSLRPAVQYRLGLSFSPVELPLEEEADLEDEYVDEPASSQALTRPKVAPKSSKATAAGADDRSCIPGDTTKAPTIGNEDKASTPSNNLKLPEKLAMATDVVQKDRIRRKRKPAPPFAPPDAATIASYDQGSHLLIIVGAPPKEGDLREMIRDLAASVHGRDGAVVYLDPHRLHGTSQHDHIDIHLQEDIQTTLAEVMRQMVMPRDPIDAAADTRVDDSDLWFELIQNDIAARFTKTEAGYDGVSFCYCRVQAEDSDDESVAGESVESPSQETFAYHEACITFNRLSMEPSEHSIEDAKQSFVCPDCWDHRRRGSYPHYLRPVPRESVELTSRQWPRLAMVVYYVEQFWPQTKHLIQLTAGLWTQLGWEIHIQPVKLQLLAEKQDVFVNLPWEAKTYHFVAVYITHGLEGEQGYQLNNSQALRPAELLDETLPVATRAVEGASSSAVFFFACGHPLHHPGLVVDLRAWVDRPRNPATVVGCLNRKLSPVYMFQVFAKWTKILVERSANPYKAIRETWVRDSMACSHSDLLCLGRNQPVEMWLYAPFQSRPLGRPLPSLLSVCPCSASGMVGNIVGGTGGLPGKPRRKIWKVKHNGKPGSLLRDIEVKAICQLCRQAWPLPQETLAGTLHRVNGVYLAVVPYFV